MDCLSRTATSSATMTWYFWIYLVQQLWNALLTERQDAEEVQKPNKKLNLNDSILHRRHVNINPTTFPIIYQHNLQCSQITILCKMHQNGSWYLWYHQMSKLLRSNPKINEINYSYQQTKLIWKKIKDITKK